MNIAAIGCGGRLQRVSERNRKSKDLYPHTTKSEILSKTWSRMLDEATAWKWSGLFGKNEFFPVIATAKSFIESITRSRRNDEAKAMLFLIGDLCCHSLKKAFEMDAEKLFIFGPASPPPASFKRCVVKRTSPSSKFSWDDVKSSLLPCTVPTFWW